MSQKKRSEVDDLPIEGFADLEDEVPAAPLQDVRRPVDSARVVRPQHEPTPPAPPRPLNAKQVSMKKRPHRRSFAVAHWGTVFSAAVIASGLGLGGAAILATGASNPGVWRLADLMSAANYLTPGDHPLVVVALMALVMGALAVFGGRALGAAMRRLESAQGAPERMVEKLTALRLDNEAPWSDAAFRDHHAAASFTAEVLGAWRLQGARYRRLMGIEGELLRLQKALADDSREALTGRFDTPSVGVLADEMVRFLDARKAAVEELAELRERNAADSEAVVSLIQDARGWNRTTFEQIGTQGAALESLSRRLEDLSIGVATTEAGAVLGVEAAATLADIRRDLGNMIERSAPQTLGLDDIADRSGKLAFQIAMEVARLGPQGERLRPHSQAFEELATGLRHSLDNQGTGFASAAADAGLILDKLDQLSRGLAQAGEISVGAELSGEIGRAGPAVAKASAKLADIAKGCQTQSDRLVKLGESVSALTGATFDASTAAVGNPCNPPHGGLLVSPQDPFCRNLSPSVEVDPFTVEAPLAAPPAPDMPAMPLAMDEPLEIERTSQAAPAQPPSAAPLAASPWDMVPLELETNVPHSGPEVHDLAEFGAVRIDNDGDDCGGPVYELSEFGAVAVN